MSVKVHEPVCLDSAQDFYFWFDHFLGDQIKDEWRVTGTGAGTVAVVDAQTGGIARITTGGTTDNNHRIDWTDKRSLLVSKKATMEVRRKLTQTTELKSYIMLFFDWSNYIQFSFNTDWMTNWYVDCVLAGDSSAVDTGIAPDTSWHVFRIECHTHDSNHVHFYIDGVECSNSPITTTIPTGYLEPYIRINTLEEVAKSMDIDYVALRQDR